MSSQEEENSFDDVEEGPLQSPFGNPLSTATENKHEKPLLDQYREVREKEESEHAAERLQLEARLRACLSQNPKIEIGKPSAIQEKVDEMDLIALRRAVTSAEDQVGFGSNTIFPKTSLKILNRALNYAGIQLSDTAYEDPQLLYALSRNMPTMTWKYADPLQTFCRLLEHVRFPGQTIMTPTIVDNTTEPTENTSEPQ